MLARGELHTVENRFDHGLCKGKKALYDMHGYHQGDREIELEEELSKALASHQKTINNFDDLPDMAFNSDNDFGDDSRLKIDSDSHSHFI